MVVILANWKDQIIHMPMESLSHHKPEPSEVTAQHSPQEIQSLLTSALEQLPNAIGMNNHMGSKLTQLTQPMKLVMQFAKANSRGLWTVVLAVIVRPLTFSSLPMFLILNEMFLLTTH